MSIPKTTLVDNVEGESKVERRMRKKKIKKQKDAVGMECVVTQERREGGVAARKRVFSLMMAAEIIEGTKQEGRNRHGEKKTRVKQEQGVAERRGDDRNRRL
jgi:hypothetical protein